jgi:hypothetical protein
MCLSSLAEDLGADCTPVKFTLSTVSGNQKRNGQQLSLDVVGVATGKGVRLNKVWTTDSLPVRAFQRLVTCKIGLILRMLTLVI